MSNLFLFFYIFDNYRRVDIIKHMNRPFVGVSVVLTKNGKVLLGKRKGAHGNGTWAFPGGHLEFGETVEACATREVLEETKIQIQSCKKLWITNDVFPGKHYVTVFVVAYTNEEPTLCEEDKCEYWQWFEPNELPAPLFLPIENLLKEKPDILSTAI
jgi:8-oxo-dGTP diphosphatase